MPKHHKDAIDMSAEVSFQSWAYLRRKRGEADFSYFRSEIEHAIRVARLATLDEHGLE